MDYVNNELTAGSDQIRSCNSRPWTLDKKAFLPYLLRAENVIWSCFVTESLCNTQKAIVKKTITELTKKLVPTRSCPTDSLPVLDKQKHE